LSIDDVEELSADERDKIFGATALRLLQIGTALR